MYRNVHAANGVPANTSFFSRMMKIKSGLQIQDMETNGYQGGGHDNLRYEPDEAAESGLGSGEGSSSTSLVGVTEQQESSTDVVMAEEGESGSSWNSAKSTLKLESLEESGEEVELVEEDGGSMAFVPVKNQIFTGETPSSSTLSLSETPAPPPTAKTRKKRVLPAFAAETTASKKRQRSSLITRMGRRSRGALAAATAKAATASETPSVSPAPPRKKKSSVRK
jgi:hypothetical protein